MHIPLDPGATWNGTYKVALEQAMSAINEFDVAGLVISLGLDTYDGVGLEYHTVKLSKRIIHLLLFSLCSTCRILWL